MRTILLHLNVQAQDADSRTVDQIVGAVEGAIEVGSDHPSLHGLEIEVALAEEV